MNKDWSALNKAMQTQIAKRDAWPAGLDTLFQLRGQLIDTVLAFRQELRREDFDAMPFINAEGLHNKSIAYSLWHVFRIEDIVAHTLVAGDAQVFFAGDWQRRIGAPIITTGNELAGQQIADFSARLDLEALYAYVEEVRRSTEAILRGLPCEALKSGVPGERKAALQALHVVSEDERAAWLVEYWCGKDIRGLIRMPFSRHWIMHVEACLRIRNRL